MAWESDREPNVKIGRGKELDDGRWILSEVRSAAFGRSEDV